MRLPIKLNRAGWPALFGRLPFAFHDPRPLAADNPMQLSPAEFSKAISTLQFGVTFKTTRPGRQKHSNSFVASTYQGLKPVILDVGASDGSTSLDLIETLGDGFKRYFVTDLNLYASYGLDHGVVFFRDRNGRCTLRASLRFIVYSETHGAPASLSRLAESLIARSRSVSHWQEAMLVQPNLINFAAHDPRVRITMYDMFTPWTSESPDLIKIANLLNLKYFSETQMREALLVQSANLRVGGRLLLVSEDEDMEKFSVFRKTEAGMAFEYEHAGGAKAAPYISLSRSICGAPGSADQVGRALQYS